MSKENIQNEARFGHKNKEILLLEETWVGFEIMLSKVNKAQKYKCPISYMNYYNVDLKRSV